MAGWRLVVGLAASGLIGASQPTSTPPAVSDIQALLLHGGVNRLPRFLPSGGGATIVQAWRDNGNAHGHFVWMVLADGGKDSGAPLVVFESGAGPQWSGETIGASPFDGERVTADVRFATARIAGEPVSLAVKGVLDLPPSGIIADHATATIRWYRFVHRDAAVGDSPDAFVEIGSIRTARRYCNVDLALRDVAGLSLPPGFAGPNRVDGCFGRG